ncbi:MAG: fibronectin type III domain-containing protein [Actinobacteria bacterium]|nr:fibronectin type III domain-containing protein [Actinomycetota bacterium]
MRSKSILITFGLLATLIAFPIQSANSYSVKSVPAPWIYTYASGQSQSIQSAPIGPSANAEKKSNFVVDFNTVPLSAQPAVQAAIDVWAENFSSKVNVNVNVTWGRSSNYGVLAAASSKSNFTFPEAPDRTLYYASAMANALAGRDLDPKNPELEITITSNAPWYLGTDGKCPKNLYDLESVILHEMGHGLGFMSGSYYDEFTGAARIDQPTPFDAYVQLPDGRRLADMPSPSLETGKALTNTLVWSGVNGIKANNNVKPKLYTPAIYEPGSSVSHLDEATFKDSLLDAVMTPNLDAGEVFHSPGPLLLAMLEDMRLKPPAGITNSLPQKVENPKALVGDQSAIIQFALPVNARAAQITSYQVKNIQTGDSVTITQSPAIFSNLKNGSKYSFSITATNDLGVSDPAVTNIVTPQASWKATVVDPSADAKYLATATFGGKQVIAYTDSKSGDLKLATQNGSKWSISTIDGNSASGGRTTNNVAGYVSLCTSTSANTNYLHVFYTDVDDLDLKYAVYNGKKWSYEVVDGDGPKIQDYKEVNRVRTASDVSVSNACAINSTGVQVFYRDESQGILLGAVKDGSSWRYEIVDGDKDTDNRTTGDVGFHLKALTVGKKIHIIYDSVNGFDLDKNVTKGEIRYATRSSGLVEDWVYDTLDTPAPGVSVAGYDVSIFNGARGVTSGWFTGSGISFPNPNQLRTNLIGSDTLNSFSSGNYGIPNSPIAIDDKSVLFGCELRLCSLNKSDKAISLVSKNQLVEGGKTVWVTINKTRYALAGVSGKLTLFKP